MKKWLYILSGVAIGIVFTVSSSAFAEQVKSLVGKKVTGEFTVIVNGNTLSDKGAVIDGKANAPVRALSETLGADVKVSGRTIFITRAEENSNELPNSNDTENKYIGKSRESIEESIRIFKENVLPLNKRERENVLEEIKMAKAAKADDLLIIKESQLKELDSTIEKTEAEIAKAETALSLLEQ